MKTTDNHQELFQTGEVTKALGITRRMLIHYEELGLVTPACKHDNRGYRYYSADNIVHIRLIRTLQDLGLSLAEIRSYFDDTMLLENQIERLVLLRNQLEDHIEQLQLRQAKTNQMEIHHVTLPSFTAYCREFHDADLRQKTDDLRKTYVEAVKNYKIDIHNKMCIQASTKSDRNGYYTIPVSPNSVGAHIKTLPQTSAICIYYRGGYENFPIVHTKLLQYAKEHGMTACGYFQNIFMEGPPTHGENTEAYITQIALPIKFTNVLNTDLYIIF